MNATFSQKFLDLSLSFDKHSHTTLTLYQMGALHHIASSYTKRIEKPISPYTLLNHHYLLYCISYKPASLLNTQDQGIFHPTLQPSIIMPSLETLEHHKQASINIYYMQPSIPQSSPCLI